MTGRADAGPAPHAIVIFGAAVRPDGRPSPALARRIAYGLAAAEAAPEALVFCSGAAAGQGPSEAAVMAKALREAFLPPDRLVLDEESRDTLQSVVAACRFLRLRGLERAVVCSDGYHLPRIRMLFGALGVAAADAPVARGPPTPNLSRFRMGVREMAAYPYDLGVVLARRRSLRAIIDAE